MGHWGRREPPPTPSLTQNNRETEVGENMQGRKTHRVAFDSCSFVRFRGWLSVVIL